MTAMTPDDLSKEYAEHSSAKHPPVETIEDVFTFKMNRFVMVNEREGHRWAKKYFDLSLNEWRVLALIKAHAPVRASDVADQMLMDKSQLSRLIKALMAKHLINSKTDHADARAIVLSLTAKGGMLYQDMMDEVLHQNEKVLEPLSAEEVLQFNDMLNRLNTHSLALLHAPLTPRDKQ